MVPCDGCLKKDALLEEINDWLETIRSGGLGFDDHIQALLFQERIDEA